MCLPWHSSFGENREEKEIWKLYLINKKKREAVYPKIPQGMLSHWSDKFTVSSGK